jgi:hypothetical protein
VLIEQLVATNSATISFVSLRDNQSLKVFIYLESSSTSSYISMVGPYEIERDSLQTSIDGNDAIARMFKNDNESEIALNQIAAVVDKKVSFFLINTCDLFRHGMTPKQMMSDHDLEENDYKSEEEEEEDDDDEDDDEGKKEEEDNDRQQDDQQEDGEDGVTTVTVTSSKKRKSKSN